MSTNVTKTHAPFNSLNSPFKWIGGKSRLRKHIIELIPDHSCYVEPFCGAAWVLFGKPSSSVEIINDKDEDLTTFFRVVKEAPEELIASFDLELVSRAKFNQLAATDPKGLTDLQRAHRFYYLIMAAWGGELNYPRIQTSIYDGGHGNRLIGAIQTLRKRIEPIHKRLSTVIIECLDWRTCIDRYDRKGVLMYVDPPYPENKCNYAHNMRSWDEHYELAERLKRSQCKWIYSSYDSPEIHTIFGSPDYQISRVQSASGLNERKGGSTRSLNREVLITNYAHFQAERSSMAEQAPAPFTSTAFDIGGEQTADLHPGSRTDARATIAQFAATLDL